MEGFKDFQGKSLDEAIQEACRYYNTAREKLEIEIVQDAKTGIFGLVGARKAKVRARRAALREAVENVLGRGEAAQSPREEHTAQEAAPKGKSKKATHVPTALQEETEAPVEEPRKEIEERTAKKAERTSTQRPPRERRADASKGGRRFRDDMERRHAAPSVPHERTAQAAPIATPEEKSDDLGMEELTTEFSSRTPLEQLDLTQLITLAKETVLTLIRPIAGNDVSLDAEVIAGRVRVAIEGVEDSGLLIGREGQTLAALQYLASRIVSRAMNGAVHIQLDAGRYRQRQDEKLQEMALALAARVRESGRSFSTRPLSSYHRRIVHVTLQPLEDIQTRSTGEGPLKRVVIMRRRQERG